MPRSPTTGIFTRVSNSFSEPVQGTVIDPTDADALFDDQDIGLSFSDASPLILIGSTSGVTTIKAADAASGTITLPAGTTDFSATGGTAQFVRQDSAGAPFTVTTIPASAIVSPAALTRIDDTNVTLTLGGNPSTALLAASSITAGWSGQLSPTRGGTGSNLSATGGTSQVLKQTTVGGNITVGQLAASDLSNGTTGSGAVALASGAVLTLPSLTGVGAFGLRSSGAGAFDLNFLNTETLTSSRNLTITVNNANRTLNLGGNLTTAGAFTTAGSFSTGGDFATSGAFGVVMTLTGSTNITLPTSGTLATTAGANIPSGTSGGVLGYTGTNTLTSSVALTQSALVLGGGAGATPTPMASLGTTTTVLHGNAGGAPTFGAVSLTADVSGILPLANGGSNANLTASNGGIFYSTASAGAILSGTATASLPLLSGATAAPTWATIRYPTSATSGGVPYFSSTSVMGSSALLAANQLVIGGGAATAPATLGSLGTTTTVLHGNAAGAPTFGAVSLTADITGTLAATNGGTGLATYTQGDILYSSASNTLAALAKNTSATRYLSNTGTSNDPAWAQVVMTTGVSDYEEGSWTPVLAGSVTPGTQTYTQQVGRYIRIGNLVTAWFNIVLTAKDAATNGNMRVTGLPYTATTLTAFNPGVTLAFQNNWVLNVAGGYYVMQATISNATSYINLWELGNNVATAALTEADFGNTSAVSGTGIYRIN